MNIEKINNIMVGFTLLRCDPMDTPKGTYIYALVRDKNGEDHATIIDMEGEFMVSIVPNNPGEPEAMVNRFYEGFDEEEDDLIILNTEDRRKIIDLIVKASCKEDDGIELGKLAEIILTKEERKEMIKQLIGNLAHVMEEAILKKEAE